MSAADPASIRSLGLSHRALHPLERAGILKVDQLAALSRAQLYEIHGIGPGSIAEIVNRLAARWAQSGLPEALLTAPPPATTTAALSDSPKTLRHERHAESQKRLLARALESFGRPAHVTDIVQRAIELSPKSSVPNSGRSLLILLNTDELITLGEGVISLVAWESARAEETRPVLPICPRPWVDLAAFRAHFFESVFTGREQLADEPAAIEFVARMLAWWGVDTGARLWVHQSIMTAYYLTGLAPYAFLNNEAARLRCDLPSLSIPDTRLHCLRTLTVRLAAMAQFWTVMWVKGAARPKELAEVFAPLHPYGLNDVEQRLYFLTALGAAERLSTGQYHLTPLGKQCATEWGQGDAAQQLRPSRVNDGVERRSPAVSTLPRPVVSAPIAPRAEPVAKPSDKLFYCPNLWPDKLTDEQAFFAFVNHARHILVRQPTTEQFLAEMLTWAGRKPDKTKRYYQSVLDICYIVGLIDRTYYDEYGNRPLRLRLPAHKDEQALREYCARSALARLEIGPRLLREAVEIQLFSCEQMQAKLMTADDNIDSHLRLFRNLGLLSRVGLVYTPTYLAIAYLDDRERDVINSSSTEGSKTIESQQEKVGSEMTPRSSGEKLSACPALLPDRVGEKGTFFDSILHAHKFLSLKPTTEEFLAEMISWAGRENPKSSGYYQNVLDSFYVVGVIDRIHYGPQKHIPLISMLQGSPDIQLIKDHCVRSAIARLKFGRQFLEKAAGLQPFSRQEIQASLDMTDYNAARHIRLFYNLGILTQDGLSHRLSTFASSYIGEHSNEYVIQPTSSEEIREPDNSWDYVDGLETLAFLGGIE